MRVLLVDNHDSYTYNLFQLMAATYGVAPVVRANDDPAWPGVELGEFDAVVLSPGPGHPRVARDVGIAPRLVLESGLPVLGVCLGHQLLGLLGGAAVERAPAPRHGFLERVEHDADGLFAGLPQRFTAVRYHSLCVADPVPDDLVVTARGDDGVVMGLCHRTRPWWGVQFHPESVATEHGAHLLRNFRDLVSAGARHTSPPPVGHDGWALHATRIAASLSPGAAERLFVELFGAQEHAFWLDSSRVEPGLSRWSHLGDAGGPCGEVLTADAGAGCVRVDRATGRSVEAGSVFDVLRSRLAERAGTTGPGPATGPAGGYVGWFGYEMKVELGSPNTHRAPTPDAVWMSAARSVSVDHETGAGWVLGACDGEPANCVRVREWVRDTTAWAERTARLPLRPAATEPAPVDAERWLDRPRERYLADIAECQRQLRAGESYEICLTTELALPFRGSPLGVYRRLRALNPAPYAGYLRSGDVHVLCSSPERFLRVDPDGVAESKPIKGTAPRGHDPAADRALRDELAASPKAQAENLMIVDLVRNDLGTVSRVGSVSTPRLMHVESYQTVHQLVSTIRGTLRDGMTAVDAVRACFPGGSMTGAPKERTMEIIARLEDRARGIYSGSIGWLAPNGAADLNIVIRTMVVHDGWVTVGAGGAIVLDSDPAEEFDEMLVKAAATLRAVRADDVGDGALGDGAQRPSVVPSGDPASPPTISA